MPWLSFNLFVVISTSDFLLEDEKFFLFLLSEILL